MIRIKTNYLSFFSNLFSEFFSFSSMFFSSAKKCKTWPSYCEKLCKRCFFKNKLSLKPWFLENIISSNFHVFEDFNFETWHVLKSLIQIVKRCGILFQNLILSRKFRLKICPFSKNFSLWKLFCFKVWNVKFSIRKLTGNKMVLSNSDLL